MIIIILAGGSGTRLWPYSKKDFPKQFLKIKDDTSLLQNTISRFEKVSFVDQIIIVTNSSLVHLVEKQIKELHPKIKISIVVEPYQKNTAPAIALSVKYITETLQVSKTEKILVMPSDHIISPEDKFLSYFEKINNFPIEKFITFGIRPTKPESGYGYIEVGEKITNDIYNVNRFIEKPNIDNAKKFLLSGRHYWNLGLFLFNLDIFNKTLKKHANSIYELSQQSYLDMFNNFNKMPNVSFDYAILEKTDQINMIPLDISWSDVGSWDSIYEVLEKDQNNNVKIGNIFTIDTKNCLLISKNKTISTIGLKDIIIVETDEGIFLAKKGKSQEIKDLIKKLQAKSKNLSSNESLLVRSKDDKNQ